MMPAKRLRVKGRGRHIMVDTVEIVLMVVVHAANIQDRDGAWLVLRRKKRVGIKGN